MNKKTSKKISREIEKLIREWKRKGTMTTSRAVYRPSNLKEALAQAAAIAYGKYKKRKKK